MSDLKDEIFRAKHIGMSNLSSKLLRAKDLDPVYKMIINNLRNYFGKVVLENHDYYNAFDASGVLGIAFATEKETILWDLMWGVEEEEIMKFENNMAKKFDPDEK